jgi:membrane protein insertase Oxa1/YidC/SpoIIIJ
MKGDIFGTLWKIVLIPIIAPQTFYFIFKMSRCQNPPTAQNSNCVDTNKILSYVMSILFCIVLLSIIFLSFLGFGKRYRVSERVRVCADMKQLELN